MQERAHHHEHQGEHCAHESKTPWVKNKTVIVTFVLASFVALSYIWAFLIPFRETLFMYIHVIWWATLLGLFLGGVMDYTVPREYISQVLARPTKRTIFHSVIFGFFMSVCSHGILALAIQLHKKGAATSSVVAFLLASPWANLPLTLILIGFFGLIKALYIILSALVIAVITGFIFQGLEAKNLIERNEMSVEYDENFSVIKDMKIRFKNHPWSVHQLREDLRGIWKGALSLSDMVLWWILIGAGLASLAGAYIPTDIFQNYMGPSVLGMSVTLLVATIMEVCSEGTAPLAFEVFRQTGALGNALVFLMAGVATDYTEIGLLWANVGHKTAIWLPIVTVPQILVLGVIANIIF